MEPIPGVGAPEQLRFSRRLFTTALVAAGLLMAACGGGKNKGPAPMPTPELADTPEVNLLAGEWDFLAGASREGNVLRITPTGTALLKEGEWLGDDQPKAGDYIPDPPVNAYGSYLTTTQGSFFMTAGLGNLTPNAQATLNLYYNRPPWNYDERRSDPPGVQLIIKDGQLRVSTRDTAEGELVEADPLELGSGAQTSFWLAQHESTLLVGAGDDPTRSATLTINLAQQPNSVFFGLDAQGGDFTVDNLKAHAFHGKGEVMVSDSSKLGLAPLGKDGLQKLAQARRDDFDIGTAVDIAPLVAELQMRMLVGEHFGMLVPETAGKPQATHPRLYRDPNGQLHFQQTHQRLDAIADVARRYKRRIHGHTDIFGEANPESVIEILEQASRQEALAIMQALIQTEGTHTRELNRKAGYHQVVTRDVVNEPFDPNDWPEFRKHIWYQALGKAYIAEAFKAARAANPKECLLFMNEWALEGDDDRWGAMLDLVDELLDQKVPIDGIGFQIHITEDDIANNDLIDPDKLRSRFAELEKRGLKVRVSEMSFPAGTDPQLQARQYAEVLKVCLEAENCVAFCMWGVGGDWYFTSEGRQGDDAPWYWIVQDGKQVPVARPAVKALQDAARG